MNVLNLSPCVPLDFDVSEKIGYARMSPMITLSTFGFKAFVHISKDERFKLDAKTR